MERRRFLQHALVLPTLLNESPTTLLEEAVANQEGIIPFIPLDKMPDNPLAAAHFLVANRPPIFYPEVPPGAWRQAIAREVEMRLRHIAQYFSFNETLLLRIARCESSLYPNSVNNSWRGEDRPTGTFQYLRSTFTRHLGLAVDFRRDLDVEALTFLSAYPHSFREWSCR